MEGNQQAASSPLERTLDVSVAMADLDKDVEKRLVKLSKSVKMAGFRAGKVPMNIITQQYGPQARHEALTAAVQKAFDEAARGQGFRVAGVPQVTPKEESADGKLDFTASFEVYPQITLGDVSGQSLERPVMNVGETEVEKTLEMLRKQRAAFVVTDREAKDGDKVTVDFVGRRNGETFAGGSGNEVPIMLGSGSMLKDFETQLLDAKAGDVRNFDLTFPEDYHAKDLAGQTVQFEVTIKRVDERRVPDLDGEFAKMMGVADGDIEKLKSEVRNNLEREVKQRIQARMKDQAMNALLEVNPIDVPKALVQQEIEFMMQQTRDDMKARGMDSNMPVEGDWFYDRALRRVKLGLLVTEVVKANGLHATPEQVREVIDEFAASYENPAAFVKFYYSDARLLQQVEAVVVEENVVEWVAKNAKTADKNVDFDELMGRSA